MLCRTVLQACTTALSPASAAPLSVWLCAYHPVSSSPTEGLSIQNPRPGQIVLLVSIILKQFGKDLSLPELCEYLYIIQNIASPDVFHQGQY